MPLQQSLILVPALAQMLMTLVVLGMLPLTRARSMRERRQRLQEMALAGKTDWNEQAQKVSSSYASQFELPTLFYALCGFALVTRSVDGSMLGLAALFVVSRIVHAIIHIGPNIVSWRFAAFAIGVVSLLAMGIRLGWSIASAAV